MIKMKVGDITPKLIRRFRVIIKTVNRQQLYDGPAGQVPHWLYDRLIIEEHPYEDAEEYIVV